MIQLRVVGIKLARYPALEEVKCEEMANLLCYHMAVSKNQKENVEGRWKNYRKSEGDEEVGGKKKIHYF